MLLNIDRILQLLAEGKDIKKISEISKLPENQISSMILEAREMLNRYNGGKVRKKVLLKKNVAESSSDLSVLGPGNEIFEGAELNAIPVDSLLNFNIAVASGGEFYKAGVLISDHEEKQVGKLHFRLLKTSERPAFIEAISKSVDIALYFSAKLAKFRISDGTLVKIINSEIKTENKTVQKSSETLHNKLRQENDFRVEYIAPESNAKADFIAKQRIKSKRPKDRK